MRDVPRFNSNFAQLITKMSHEKRSFRKLGRSYRFFQELNRVFWYIAWFIIIGFIIFCIPILIEIAWDKYFVKPFTRMKGMITTFFQVDHPIDAPPMDSHENKHTTNHDHHPTHPKSAESHANYSDS